MTISDKSVIRKMLMNNGQYEDEYPCPLIYQYRTMDGQNNFACFTSPDLDDMATSPWVRDVICLMAGGMLTSFGKVWLLDSKNN